MNKRATHASFVSDLKKKMRSLKKMKEGDVHVFTINANYGRYKIIKALGTGSMEFIEGEPLVRIIKAKSFRFEEIINIGLQILESALNMYLSLIQTIN